jgi:hypothetical protein
VKQAEAKPHEPGNHDIMSRGMNRHVVKVTVNRISHLSVMQQHVDRVMQPDFIKDNGAGGKCEVQNRQYGKRRGAQQEYGGIYTVEEGAIVMVSH